MENDEYSVDYDDSNSRFVNDLELWPNGPFMKSILIKKEYSDFGKFIEVKNISDIGLNDIRQAESNITIITGDDIEDLKAFTEKLPQKNGDEFFKKIIGRLYKDNRISDELISKYDLSELLIGIPGIDSRQVIRTFEDFPQKPISNENALENHIQKQWKRSYSMKYVAERTTTWRPQKPFNRDYLNMYESKHFRGEFYCQMCKKLKPVVDHDNIDSEPAYAWDQMRLCLCLECSRKFKNLRNDSQTRNKFISKIMSSHPVNENVEIAIGSEMITFTATHLAEVQKIFKIQGWGDNAPKRNEVCYIDETNVEKEDGSSENGQ